MNNCINCDCYHYDNEDVYDDDYDSPHDDFFSTYLICDICDKYEV